MRKIYILITIILSLSLLIGCSGNILPEDTVKKFCNYIKNSNLDGCISLFDKDSKNKYDALTDKDNQEFEETFKMYSKTFKSMEVLDIKENEDKAEVKVKITLENINRTEDIHTEDIKLVKENNEWRITEVF